VYIRVDLYTGFWWGNLSERDQLEDPGFSRRITLRWIFGSFLEGGGVAWIGLVCFRIQTGGGHL